MASFLYSITIYPLELAYQLLYVLFSGLTHNYGLGLLCLSLVSTVIFAPLKQLAAAMQAREALIQQVMAPQLARIKEQSRGAERQARTVALYRRYAYHPLLALRSSFGILLQVPFLCAAYYMLSDFAPIQGQACWIIPDLAKPDGLLYGVHALPLLMTLFNIGAVYTTKGFTRRDRLQALVVAALFLLLLYSAPSALLIYWTGNNALMLLGNLMPHGLSSKMRTWLGETAWGKRAAENAAVSREAVGVPAFLKFTTGLGACIVFFFLAAWAKIHEAAARVAAYTVTEGAGDPIYLGSLLVFAIAGSAVCAALFFAARRSTHYVVRYACCFVLLFALGHMVYAFFSLTSYATEDTVAELLASYYWWVQFSFTAACCVGLNLVALHSRVYAYLNIKEERSLFMYAALVLCLLLIFFAPGALYSSSPEFFRAKFATIIFDILPWGIVLLLVLCVIRLLLPGPVKVYGGFLLLAGACIGLLNATISAGNYGALDGTVLSNAAELDAAGPLLFDLFVFLATVCGLAAVFYFRQAKKMIAALQATALLLVFSGIPAFFTENKTAAAPAVPWTDVAAKDAVFSFSKTEPNVVVFFLDMFTGGHIPEIFAERRELAQRFQGFTWYPDTVAETNMTSGSSPSIFGGPAFTPERMNARPELTLHQKYTEALATLPRNFGDAGYDVSFLHLLYPLDAQTFAKHSGGRPAQVTDKPALDGIIYDWARKIGMDERAIVPVSFREFMFSLSLFKATPHVWKKAVYNYGNWLPGATNEYIVPTLYESAVLGMLPQMSRIASAKPTLKFIYNLLPHYDWHLPKDSLIPQEDPYPDTEGQLIMVDGLLPEHVYAEKHTMALLGGFMDWLRREGIYDNTMVILVSDHCEGDSRMLNEALGVNQRGRRSKWPDENAYPGRPHALLMVKGLGDNKPFRRSDALMSTADVPALACAAIGGCPGLLLPDTGPARVRHHFVAREWRQIEVPDKKVYDPAKTATIRGTMFKKENWSFP